MRRLAVSLLALAALAGLPPVAGAGDGALSLTEAGRPRFPERAYLLSLPAGALARPDQIHVFEDGRTVRDVSVLPASAASSRGFGVVLAIDTSLSMKGRPIRNALAAARAFAKRRHPSEQLGIVTFNRDPAIAQPLTKDDGEIESALARPPVLGRDTHVYDAVDTAIRMLADAQVKPASVVVLSDGADNGSAIGSARVATTARRNGVRVFTVGLRSGAFDPQALTRLARGAGGAYEEASAPGDLTHIFDELGARLATEHLITYRSLAGPHDRVHVSMRVDGISSVATTEYTTPAVRAALAPYDPMSFWSSPASVLLVSLTCGLLVVATFYFAFSRPERRKLRRRVAGFVAPSPAGAPQAPEAHALTSPALLANLGRAFEGMRWWPGFEEELDVARIAVPAARLAGATVAATLLTSALLGMISGNVLVAALGLLLPLAVRWFVKFKLQRQRRAFADQLADNLQVISSALRAGHSLVGAMSVAVHDAPHPTKREFERVLADEKLGIPLDDGLSVVARRMQNRDLEQVVLVASLQRETGGNTAEVLDRVADTVRERADLRRIISTLTAQGRISRWVVTALPLVVTGAISAINPDYLSPLFQTGTGHAMLVLALVLLVAGSLAIKKIVDIKV